jgi:UDP-3-O-[3-hydroxymyristoyl] glucosamine N-acyltransferase
LCLHVFVSGTAVIYDDVEIGDFSRVLDSVVLRERTQIGADKAEAVWCAKGFLHWR